jgi:hypothetical protein
VWSSSLFTKLPELEFINEQSVDLSAGGQPINSEDKEAMKGFEGARYFIVMDLSFTTEKDSAGVFISVESPDSFVYLYDSKRKRIHMVSHVGSGGMIHNHIWITKDVFAILSNLQEDGYISVYSIAGGWQKTYKAKGRKINHPDIEAYLIKAHYKSGIRYRME